MPRYELHGYVVVSEDDCISNADGVTPPELYNEADWSYFQSELDRAVLNIIGRVGHTNYVNTAGRRRLVVSSQARGVEERPDAWWWNPAEASLGDALRRAAPEGGRIAIAGGRRVNDLFLSLGFDGFHLTRRNGVRLPGGVPVFTRAWAAGSAERLLRGHGLHPTTTRVLDAAENVTLTVWVR